MPGIPQHVGDDIAFHLDAIRAHFRDPKVTLIVRPQIGPGKDADVVMTDDELPLVAAALVRRAAAGADR